MSIFKICWFLLSKTQRLLRELPPCKSERKVKGLWWVGAFTLTCSMSSGTVRRVEGTVTALSVWSVGGLRTRNCGGGSPLLITNNLRLQTTLCACWPWPLSSRHPVQYARKLRQICILGVRSFEIFCEIFCKYLKINPYFDKKT